MKSNSTISFSAITHRKGGSGHRRDFTFDAARSTGTHLLGSCADESLELEVVASHEPEYRVFEGCVRDTTGKDHAVSFFFELHVDAREVVWHDDIRRSRKVNSSKVYDNTLPAECGSGAIGKYPVGTISGIDAAGRRFCKSIALDPTRPAPFSIGFDTARAALFIRYDVALVPETANFPSAAPFRFVVFDSDPAWGFRGAYDKYMRLFPEPFTVRSRSQGIWMPFTDVEKVAGQADFGFRYHEMHGVGNEFDSANGIAAYNYTEPFTWWMNMPKDMPRTYENAVALMEEYAKPECRDADLHQHALALKRSGMRRPDGKFAVAFYDLPWCDGACWTMNPNPAQPFEPSGATINWSDALKAERHPPMGRLAGEYIDSTEGYTTPELNFDRAAFAYETVPLAFDKKTYQPGILKGLAVFEFTRKAAADMHALGKTLFGNGVPYRFSWLLANFDIMGTETVWLGKDKTYAPEKDWQMALWRTLSGRKPYVLLQNTDFHAFDSTMVERYMQRVLFYALYPSMFSVDAASSPYWEDASLYNRDRALFKKYVPLVRELGETGWEPVTLAVSSNDKVLVERYGRRYLTLCNDEATPQKTTVKVMFPARRKAVERLSGAKVKVATDGTFEIELAPQSSAMVDFGE